MLKYIVSNYNNLYRKEYPNGIYIDSALYFNGDCFKQIKQEVLVHISDDFHIEFKKLDYQKKI